MSAQGAEPQGPLVSRLQCLPTHCRSRCDANLMLDGYRCGHVARHILGQAVISDEVRAGHRLAAMLCNECHIAALDQALPTRRDPPAPSFESIAQRKDVNADSLEHFLKTTHQGLDDPERMENPGLADFSGESRSSVYPEVAQNSGRTRRK